MPKVNLEVFELVKMDAVSTHNFCKSEEWGEDSTWELTPGDGEIWELMDSKVFLSSDVVLNKEVDIEFYANGIPDPLQVVTYRSRGDFIVRADAIEILDMSCDAGNDVTGKVHIFTLNFAQDVILWDSSGVDENGVPKEYEGNVKLSKMVIRVRDNLPLLNASNEEAQLARCRYSMAVRNENVSIEE